MKKRGAKKAADVKVAEMKEADKSTRVVKVAETNVGAMKELEEKMREFKVAMTGAEDKMGDLKLAIKEAKDKIGELEVALEKVTGEMKEKNGEVSRKNKKSKGLTKRKPELAVKMTSNLKTGNQKGKNVVNINKKTNLLNH